MIPFLYGHITEMYPMQQNYLPMNIPVFPPGLINPILKNTVKPDKQFFENRAHTLNERLQDFQQNYQKIANSMFSQSRFGILPPGHPLYTKDNSLQILKDENNKLAKENLELKKQIEKLARETHTPGRV